MVASMFGGVNIEEVFKSSPDSIYTDPIDITKGSIGALQHPIHMQYLDTCTFVYFCCRVPFRMCDLE